MSKCVKTLYRHYVDVSDMSPKVVRTEEKLRDVLSLLPEEEQEKLNLILNEYYERVQYQGYKAGLQDGINLGMNTRR